MVVVMVMLRRSRDLTFGAFPGRPHVFHADVEVGTVEVAVFGFGVVVLQVLPEKLRRGRP